MKLKLNKRYLAVIPFLAAGIFFVVRPAAADGTTWVTSLLTGIIQGLISGIGGILTLVMGLLIDIAQYNSFISSPAIENGWVILRDVSNMFFVLILLVIAFATILRVEQYSYKKWLPKLLMMAVLINFSKTICGLLIDFAQVIMLTFVNAFKTIGGGNLVTMLGIKDWLSLSQGAEDVDDWKVLGAFMLALIYTIIALVVIVTMLGMLVMRIIMIWIYVVLSPIAFLLAAFPGGKKYSEKWWGDFTGFLIVGPVLAFFIWLSFASVATDSTPAGFTTNNAQNESQLKTTDELADAGSSQLMLKFVISIAMLIGGLKIASEVGGEVGGIAKKGMGAINKGTAFVTGAATTAGAFALGKAKAAGISVAKTAGSAAKTGLQFVDRGAGSLVDAGLNNLRTGRIGRAVEGSKLGQKLGLSNLGRSDIRSSGLVGGAVGLAATAPGKVSNLVSGWLRGSQDSRAMDEKRRAYYEQEKTQGKGNASMSVNGMDYVANDKGEFVRAKKNAAGQWEEDTSITGADAQLTDKNGKNVKRMSGAAASWYDSVASGFRKTSAVADQAKSKEVEEKQKELLATGHTNDELNRMLNSATTPVINKMAAAMILAQKGALKDKASVDKAKAVMQSTPTLASRFNDEVDKNQAHINYDLSIDEKTGEFKNKYDAEKFKNRVDYGKIDPSRMQAAAYKDPGMHKALNDFYGEFETSKILSSVGSRGKKYKEAVATGALANRKQAVDPTDPTKKLDRLANDDRSANIHAALTGNVHESFTVNGKFDAAAFSRYLSSRDANAANLNNISAANLGSGSGSLLEQMARDVSASKLKLMHRHGGNDELVRTLVAEIKRQAGVTLGGTAPAGSKAAAIQNDAELNNI